jgi:hypothetical protein
MDARITKEVKLIFEVACALGFFIGLYVGSTLVKWVTRGGGEFPHVPFNLFCVFMAIVLFAFVSQRIRRLTAS